MALLPAVAACGSGDDGESGRTATVGTTEGDVAVSGSSTVAPISAYVADEFNFNGSPASVAVDDPGTGDGIALFCEGAIDVAGASRPIKDEEIETCASAGIDFVELEIALDGITVLTSAENTGVSCLTFADLQALFGPDSEGVGTWQDAERLGATTDLPELDLDITAPGVESGTYDAFLELALDDAEALRPDYSSQADDNSIIAGIEGSQGGLGFVGFAFAEAAGDGVREVAIDGGEGCVEPSVETIADGSYPLSRSLFVYVNVERADANPAVAEYVDFYLSDISLDTLVAEAGYVPLPPERIAATRQRWAGQVRT